MRILLADDCPDNTALIQAYLEHSPYELDTAQDGAVAVEKFTSGHYDLVLMDLHMPVMDGYMAVKKMREWEREHNLKPAPILALTASGTDDGGQESIEAGCTAHLSKPIKKSMLLETMQQALNGLASVKKATEGGAIVVEADPDLRELIPNFLAGKRQEATTISAAIQRCDYETVRALGHKVKGEGGGFGFDEISAIGADLERAAKAKDADAASSNVRRLVDYLNRVQVVYPESARSSV